MSSWKAGVAAERVEARNHLREENRDERLRPEQPACHFRLAEGLEFLRRQRSGAEIHAGAHESNLTLPR